MVGESIWVLVVEDDLGIRATLKLMLESVGYRVVVAGHGKEALDILRSGQLVPRLIVLDLNMPVMDGWTFLGILQKDEGLSKIPIIVGSAERVHPDEVPLGANRFISKPFEVDSFLNAVHAVIDNSTHQP